MSRVCKFGTRYIEANNNLGELSHHYHKLDPCWTFFPYNVSGVQHGQLWKTLSMSLMHLLWMWLLDLFCEYAHGLPRQNAFLGHVIYFACMQDQHPNPSKVTKSLGLTIGNMELNANGTTIHIYVHCRVYLSHWMFYFSPHNYVPCGLLVEFLETSI
jgi:hypothetical protein